MNLSINHLPKESTQSHSPVKKMAANLVSAKVSVFLHQDRKDFPQVFPKVLLGTNTN